VFLFGSLVPFLSPIVRNEGTPMLETLVSSRIRRTLFEHLLTHPHDRFYLRGLAKALGLSVSPLRRELKRLEHVGVLRADQEGNILFYTVNPSSPAFLQLQHAGLQTEAPSLPSQTHVGFGVRGSGGIPVGVISAQPELPGWRRPLRTPALIAVATAGMAVLLMVASLLYVSMTNRQLAMQAVRALSLRRADAVVAPAQPSASGAMRGSRWQILPGAFGGFSSGASDESY
jgi:hypothetical protein